MIGRIFLINTAVRLCREQVSVEVLWLDHAQLKVDLASV